MKPREVQKRLEADGWRELPGGKTSHKQFKHPEKTRQGDGAFPSRRH